MLYVRRHSSRIRAHKKLTALEEELTSFSSKIQEIQSRHTAPLQPLSKMDGPVTVSGVNPMLGRRRQQTEQVGRQRVSSTFLPGSERMSMDASDLDRDTFDQAQQSTLAALEVRRC